MDARQFQPIGQSAFHKGGDRMSLRVITLVHLGDEGVGGKKGVSIRFISSLFATFLILHTKASHHPMPIEMIYPCLHGRRTSAHRVSNDQLERLLARPFSMGVFNWQRCDVKIWTKRTHTHVQPVFIQFVRCPVQSLQLPKTYFTIVPVRVP